MTDPQSHGSIVHSSLHSRFHSSQWRRSSGGRCQVVRLLVDQKVDEVRKEQTATVRERTIGCGVFSVGNASTWLPSRSAKTLILEPKWQETACSITNTIVRGVGLLCRSRLLSEENHRKKKAHPRPN